MQLVLALGVGSRCDVAFDNELCQRERKAGKTWIGAPPLSLETSHWSTHFPARLQQ